MILRKYRSSDCEKMAQLFYETVHSVNAADYTEEQLDAWADGSIDMGAWDRSFRESFCERSRTGVKRAGYGSLWMNASSIFSRSRLSIRWSG